MGCSPLSHWLEPGWNYTPKPIENVNPDPEKFKIKRQKKIGHLYISEIEYIGCTTFEGLKILVTKFNPKKRDRIDPHFDENGEVMARFNPGVNGWENARWFAANYLDLSGNTKY